MTEAVKLLATRTAWRVAMIGFAIMAIARGIRTYGGHPYVEPEMIHILERFIPAANLLSVLWIMCGLGLLFHGVITPGRPPYHYRVSLNSFIGLSATMALACLGSIPFEHPTADLLLWASVYGGTTLLGISTALTTRVTPDGPS